MVYRLWVVGFWLMLVMGCTAIPAPVATVSPLVSPLTPTAVSSGQLVLSVGEQGQLPGSDLRITFQAVLEDSRCPADVDCAWAGQARIQLLLEQATAEPLTLELAFMTDTTGQVTRQPVDASGELLARVGDVAVTIVSLLPYPTQLGADETEPAYQLTLTVATP